MERASLFFRRCQSQILIAIAAPPGGNPDRVLQNLALHQILDDFPMTVTGKIQKFDDAASRWSANWVSLWKIASRLMRLVATTGPVRLDNKRHREFAARAQVL
jgi:hypothetical protein